MARHIIKQTAIGSIAVLAVFAINCGSDDTQYRQAVQESIEEARAEIEQQEAATEVEQQTAQQQAAAEVEQQAAQQEAAAEVEQQAAQQEAAQQERVLIGYGTATTTGDDNDGTYSVMTTGDPPEYIQRRARFHLAQSVLQRNIDIDLTTGDHIVLNLQNENGWRILLDDDVIGGWICEIEIPSGKGIHIVGIGITEYTVVELFEAGPAYEERIFILSQLGLRNETSDEGGWLILNEDKYPWFVYLLFWPTTSPISFVIDDWAIGARGPGSHLYCTRYHLREPGE